MADSSAIEWTEATCPGDPRLLRRAAAAPWFPKAGPEDRRVSPRRAVLRRAVRVASRARRAAVGSREPSEPPGTVLTPHALEAGRLTSLDLQMTSDRYCSLSEQYRPVVPRAGRYARACAAAHSVSRPSSSGDAEPTSTIASAGRPARPAAATMASGEGAS